MKKNIKKKDIQINKKNILYVKNDLYTAKTIMEILETLGYDTTLTTRSTEAIRLLKSQPALFDIIITDEYLKGLNGLDLSEELLRIKSNIHIILCTGDRSIDSEEIKKTTGIKEILFKPFTIDELKKILPSDGVT